MKIIRLALIALILISCKESKNNPKASEKKEDQYSIAYNVLYDEENDDYEVFTMNIDGSNPANLTNLRGVEWIYDASGRDVYFISDQDTAYRHYFLYKTDLKGREPKKFFNMRLADSWMDSRKNGSELIVRPHRSVDTAFYIIDSLGEIKSRITPDLAYFNDPTFSPDGKRIVFRGATKPFKKDSGYRDELYIMEADGNNLQKLSTYPAADTTAHWYSYHAGPPRWHPSENFISFQSFRNGKYSLYAIAPDGSREWKLFKNDSLHQGWHDWSENGKWLAIGVSDLEQENYHIQLINWETKEARILTDTTYKYQQAPVFVKKD